MKLKIQWSRPIILKDVSRQKGIYSMDVEKLPKAAGIYVFGRCWGRSQFEALYVGKASNIRGRVKSHFNNLSLMQHLKGAKSGRRIVLAGRFVAKPGQQVGKCLRIVERSFIRYFLSEGDDLVNKQGTRLRRHEVTSVGSHPKRFFAGLIYVDKAKGE